MEKLYEELWGKQKVDVIKDRTFSVYKPEYCFRPGYQVNLKAPAPESFPEPESEMDDNKRVFMVLKIGSELPCGKNRLLVRQEFVDAEHELGQVELEKWTDVDSETGIPAEDLNLDYNIAGQPGCGKSFFLSYLLVRRINAGQPTALRINDSDCYLFDNDSHGSKTDANSLFNLPENRKRDLWILTDEALEDARWNKRNHGWFVVLAASPAKVQKSRQWEKQRNPGVHYMCNWEWDEIVAAFSIQKRKPTTPEQIRMLFTIFTSLGPIARTCLQTISMRNEGAYNRSLERYVTAIDKEITTYLKDCSFHTVDTSIDQHASHRIAIMEASDNRLSYTLRIASRWIAYRVFEQAQAKSKIECFKLYQQLSSQGQLRSGAGWFFEGYAHEWFGQGGSFVADSLPIKDTNTPPLEFRTSGSKPLNHFENAKDLAKMVRVKGVHGIEPDVIGKYFLPYNANLESVDGLVFSAPDTLILLQITIAKSHSIKLRGLKRLCDSLPATIKNIHIVFVIPDDLISEYSTLQNVPLASDVRPKAKDLTINQFRLVLTEEKILSMALAGPSKMRVDAGGGNESGRRDHDEGDMAMSGIQ